MNTRTRLLLGVMVLFVGAWVGDQFGLLAFLDGSNNQNDSELDKIAKQIAKAEDIIKLGVRADNKLVALNARSLPYDSEAARKAYLTWLTQLAIENEIKQSRPEVTSPPVVISAKGADGKSKEAYKRYGFTLNGVGRLENVTQFLFSFYRAGHLHKITSLTLTPSSGGMFNVGIAGEALSIPTCDRKSELTSQTANSCKFASVDEYAHIVRRNIFSPDGGVALKQIALSSVTFDKSGNPEAWFKVGATNATKRMQREDAFDFSVHRIQVIDIQPRSVMIDLDGKILNLPIGKSVKDALSAY